MEALYDERGVVYAWLDAEADRILNLAGQTAAFIDNDSIYNLRGLHIGWWEGDHVLDKSGAVAGFTENAGNIGVTKPTKGTKPTQPTKGLVPTRPPKSSKRPRPDLQFKWSTKSVF